MSRSGILQFPYPFIPPHRPDDRVRKETEETNEDLLIMQRLSSGSRAALDELLSIHWASVVAYVTRMTGDGELARDIAQETFLKTWERREQWQGGSVRGYLLRIARNLMLDQFRRRDAGERALSRSDIADRPSPATPEQVFRNTEINQRVVAVIETLSPRRREAFTLIYLRGLSYREAAEVMDVAEKTVGNHLSAALEELRKKLSPLIEREAGVGLA